MASRPPDPFARLLAPREAKYRRQRTVRRSREACVALLVACTAASLAARAESYAGVPLSPGTGDPEIRNLARLARAGDKHAQLQLGIRYEEGRSVPVNVRRAARLYRAAAATTGGQHVLHIPARGGGGVSAVQVNGGALRHGLPEARLRLMRIACRRSVDRVLRPVCAR